MSKKELECKGCRIMEALNEYQLMYIIALAEKMFLQGGGVVQHG